MIVFYKKKEYLANLYTLMFKENSLVLIGHLNTLKVLNSLRADSESLGFYFKIIKNNMAKKVPVTANGFKQVFVGSTVCLYSKSFDIVRLGDYLFKYKDVLFVVGAKFDNCLITSRLLQDLIEVYKFDKNMVLSKSINVLVLLQVQLFKGLFKFYYSLFQICQR